MPQRLKRKPRSKYGAVPTVVGGIRFASKAEARRYGELKLLEKAGQIQDIETQVPLPLRAWGEHGTGQRIGEYRADFSYWTPEGVQVLEDVKGFDTPLSKWKRKHVQAQYGIQVQVIR